MIVKGIIFDINGTLTDINTNEWHDDLYRVISNLLSYQGILLAPNAVKELYFQIMKEQRAARAELHPEFDAIAIFRRIVTQHATDFTRSLSKEKLEQLPILLAETYRAASRFRLQLYPGVLDTLGQLQQKYHLAAITDGQVAYALPELNAVGLSGIFNPIVVSGIFGSRKPDDIIYSFPELLNAVRFFEDRHGTE